ncbi:hypothetical protein D3C81_1141200 [compost metagenome]
MAALVMGEQGIAGLAERLAQALIAPGMLGHAVGQQHHRLDRRGRQPLINVEAAVIAGRKPERVVVHGGSLCTQVGESAQCITQAHNRRVISNKIHNVNDSAWRICHLRHTC